MSRGIKLYTLNMYNSFYIISILIKLLNFGGKRVKGGCLPVLTKA